MRSNCKEEAPHVIVGTATTITWFTSDQIMDNGHDANFKYLKYYTVQWQTEKKIKIFTKQIHSLHYLCLYTAALFLSVHWYIIHFCTLLHYSFLYTATLFHAINSYIISVCTVPGTSCRFIGTLLL